jgi:signal transduction histidine kinase
MKRNTIIKALFLIIGMTFGLFAQDKSVANSLQKDILNEKLHDTTRASAYLRLAKHNEHDAEKAIKTLENAVNFIEKVKSKDIQEKVEKKLTYQLAIAETEIGRMLMNLHQVKVAIPHLFKALKSFEKIKDKQGIVKNYIDIGLAFNSQKEYKKSNEYFSKAIKFSTEINDLKLLGKAYINYSVSLYEQKKPEASMEFVLKSLEAFKKANDKQGISYSLYNLAQKYNDSGNPQKAMPYLIQSLEIRKEIEDKRGIVESLNAIGVCYRWMGDVKTSLKYLEEANTMAKKEGFIHVLESSSDMLNYIYEEDLKDYKNGLRTYRMYIQARDSVQNQKTKTVLLEQHYKYEFDKKEALLKEETEAEKQKQKIIFISVVCILILLIGSVMLWSYFYRKRKQQERKLQENELLLKVAEAERRRISADLHDDLGVGIAGISLLSNQILKENAIDITHQKALKISDNIKKINEKLTEIIWELNEEHNNLEDLLLFVQKQGNIIFRETNVLFSMVIPLEIPKVPLNSYERKQIYLSLKECFHNINKHAQAATVRCLVSFNGSLILKVIDDGIGFNSEETITKGEGLQNIKYRISQLKGNVLFESKTNGTEITFTIPLKK